MARISVIIPFYNVEKYIGPCLDSVLSQSFRDIEVLCVDDGGKDGSRAIVDRYAAQDERIRILEYGGNRGIGPARNVGMDAMSAPLFMFVDSDDLLAEGALQSLYEAWERTGADMVMGRFHAFADEDRSDLHSSVAMLNPTFDLMTALDVQVTLDNFQRMLDVSYAVVWGKLYSSEYMRQYGIRFHDSKILHEDKGFHLKTIASLPRVVCTGELALLYRIRSNSSMTSATKQERRRRKQDIITAVKDGVEHIYKMHDSETAEKLVELTKSHRSFAPNLETRYLGGLLRFRWYKHEKLVELFRIQLYREKVTRAGVKEYRLLGICLHRTPNPA